MLGQYATSKASSLDRRIFVYEVIGLRESEITAGHQAPIRQSHGQFLQVPFHRMNEEMRRITLLGGRVVNIRPLDIAGGVPTASPPVAEDNGAHPEDDG